MIGQVGMILNGKGSSNWLWWRWIQSCFHLFVLLENQSIVSVERWRTTPSQSSNKELLGL